MLHFINSGIKVIMENVAAQILSAVSVLTCQSQPFSIRLLNHFSIYLLVMSYHKYMAF